MGFFNRYIKLAIAIHEILQVDNLLATYKL